MANLRWGFGAVGLVLAGALLSGCPSSGAVGPTTVPESAAAEAHLARYRDFAAMVYRYAAAQRGSFVVAPLPAWIALQTGVRRANDLALVGFPTTPDPLLVARTLAPLHVQALRLENQNHWIRHPGMRLDDDPYYYNHPWAWEAFGINSAEVRSRIIGRFVQDEESPWIPILAPSMFEADEFDSGFFSTLDVGCDWAGKSAPVVHAVQLGAGKLYSVKPSECNLDIWIAEPEGGAAELAQIEAEMTEVDLFQRLNSVRPTSDAPPQITTRAETITSIGPLVRSSSVRSGNGDKHKQVAGVWTGGDLTLKPEGVRLRSSGFLVLSGQRTNEDLLGPSARPSSGRIVVIWERNLNIPLAIARFIPPATVEP